jgi:hypothetical protein
MFRPTLLNGQAGYVLTAVDVNFTMSRKEENRVGSLSYIACLTAARRSASDVKPSKRLICLPARLKTRVTGS